MPAEFVLRCHWPSTSAFEFPGATKFRETSREAYRPSLLQPVAAVQARTVAAVSVVAVRLQHKGGSGGPGGGGGRGGGGRE